jgi:DNA-binding response OmpR family regulator
MAKKITILLVEDDQYTRELYEEIFQEAGFQVITATDGEIGLTKMVNENYDLALLDIMMPKLDGLGLLTQFNKDYPGKKHAPIVMLTNLANPSLTEQALKNGAAACWIKSELNPDQLVAKINNIVTVE